MACQEVSEEEGVEVVLPFRETVVSGKEGIAVGARDALHILFDAHSVQFTGSATIGIGNKDSFEPLGTCVRDGFPDAGAQCVPDGCARLRAGSADRHV